MKNKGSAVRLKVPPEIEARLHLDGFKHYEGRWTNYCVNTNDERDGPHSRQAVVLVDTDSMEYTVCCSNHIDQHGTWKVYDE